MRNSTVYVRRDPFREFDALVRRSFPDATNQTERQVGFVPAAQAGRDGEDAVIQLDLPGVDIATDVTVEVKGRQLVISGERRDAHTEQAKVPMLREFRYGTFRRAFRLSPSVTGDDVTAAYDNGVLTVRVAGAYAEVKGHKVAIVTNSAAPVAAEAQVAEELVTEEQPTSQADAVEEGAPQADQA